MRNSTHILDGPGLTVPNILKLGVSASRTSGVSLVVDVGEWKAGYAAHGRFVALVLSWKAVKRKLG